MESNKKEKGSDIQDFVFGVSTDKTEACILFSAMLPLVSSFEKGVELEGHFSWLC